MTGRSRPRGGSARDETQGRGSGWTLSQTKVRKNRSSRSPRSVAHRPRNRPRPRRSGCREDQITHDVLFSVSFTNSSRKVARPPEVRLVRVRPGHEVDDGRGLAKTKGSSHGGRREVHEGQTKVVHEMQRARQHGCGRGRGTKEISVHRPQLKLPF